MEYEKAFFRVYERMLDGNLHKRTQLLVLSKICFFSSFLVFLCVIISQLSYSRGGGCVHQAWDQYLLANQGKLYPSKSEAVMMDKFSSQGDSTISDAAYWMFANKTKSKSGGRLLGQDNNTVTINDTLLPFVNQSSIDVPVQNRTSFYMKGDILNFFIMYNSEGDLRAPLVPTSSKSYPYIPPVLASNFSLKASIVTVTEEYAMLGLTKRNVSWFTPIHTVPVDAACVFKQQNFLGRFIDQVEDIVIFDVISAFPKVKENLAINSRDSKSYWLWKSWQLKVGPGLLGIPLTNKIYEVVYLFFGLVLVSFSLSLYAKAVNLLSPMLIYAMVTCCGERIRQMNPALGGIQQNGFWNQFHRAFTWVGIYLKTLKRRRNSKKFEFCFMASILMMIFLFYFSYLYLFSITQKILFTKASTVDLEGGLFAFLAMMELISMFMFRTRESLYFGPKLIYLGVMIYLLYVNFTIHGFYSAAVVSLNLFAFGVIAFCLGAFEMPARMLRDADFNKPTMNRPRVLYQPLFSITWYHDLPPFWTTFLPFYDRTYFTPEEMSLLDQNYQMLMPYLRNQIRDQDQAGEEMEQLNLLAAGNQPAEEPVNPPAQP